MCARRTSLTFQRIGRAVALATTWFVVLLRIQPWPFSDYAVFLAVGQRLRAGDVLYSGIWDNKDPFVYYSIAALQGIGQPALWALEAAWFVIASVSIYSIARTYLLPRSWARLLGGVLTPIILIPFHYFPGTTHIPGVALSLAALALFLGNRCAITGIALGLLILFKLSMLPIALVGLAVLVLRRRSWRSLLPIGIGGALTVSAGLLIVTIRGELGPYLASLVHNFTYSQTNTETGGTGLLAVMAERLTVLTDMNVAVTIALIAILLAITVNQRKHIELWDVTAASFLTALVLILAIGKFPHHAQVLGVSAALAIVVLALATGRAREAQPFIASAVAVLIALALAGIPDPKGYRDALVNYQGTWNAMTTIDPSTQDLLDSGGPRKFAIVQGGGLPRSPGLEDWELACRHIAQRPWESDELLSESLECFPTAEVLMIPRGFTPASEPPAYRRFTESVAELLERDYVCTDASSSTLCVRTRDER